MPIISGTTIATCRMFPFMSAAAKLSFMNHEPDLYYTVRLQNRDSERPPISGAPSLTVQSVLLVVVLVTWLIIAVVTCFLFRTPDELHLPPSASLCAFHPSYLVLFCPDRPPTSTRRSPSSRRRSLSSMRRRTVIYRSYRHSQEIQEPPYPSFLPDYAAY